MGRIEQSHVLQSIEQSHRAKSCVEIDMNRAKSCVASRVALLSKVIEQSHVLHDGHVLHHVLQWVE